jgi:hypothetical protein
MKFYIRHDNCGEVFDDVQAAADHDIDQIDNESNTYTLITEEEAF